MARRRLWWRHLLSVLLAPAMMTVFIPWAIAAATGVEAPDLSTTKGLTLAALGGLLIAAGLAMLVWTVVLFDRVGEGTLAIGSPVRLVVRGPYRHVRNPMMTGVFCIHSGRPSPWRRHGCSAGSRSSSPACSSPSAASKNRITQAIWRGLRRVPAPRPALDPPPKRVGTEPRLNPVRHAGPVLAHRECCQYPTDYGQRQHHHPVVQLLIGTQQRGPHDVEIMQQRV